MKPLESWWRHILPTVLTAVLALAVSALSAQAQTQSSDQSDGDSQSTEDIRNFLNGDPDRAARVSPEQLCELEKQLLNEDRIAETPVICQILADEVEKPDGLSAEESDEFDRKVALVKRAHENMDALATKSEDELFVCKLMLCMFDLNIAKGLEACRKVLEKAATSFPLGKRPTCPMVKW